MYLEKKNQILNTSHLIAETTFAIVRLIILFYLKLQ